MRPFLVFSLVLAPLPLCAADTPALTPPGAVSSAEPSAQPAVDAYWRAMKLLRDGKPADWPQVRALLKQATDAEYPAALNFVALCHLNKQYGFTKDAARAANFLRLSAGQGNAAASLLLGRCYLLGTGVRKDRAQAASWFSAILADNADFSVPQPPADFFPTPASSISRPGTLSGARPVDPADQLRASAHMFLGQISAANKKPAEAQDHYVKAAAQGANHSAGVYEAAIMAAINYAFGQGVPRDMAKAHEMLALSKTLARRNVLLVTQNMVEQKLVDDFAQADVEEDASAETDKIETQLQFAIAGSFADPKSKTYDPKEAAKWYELAAEKNEAWAMLSLAFLHHEGRLGQPDPTKAFEWFKKAAEQNNHNLGWANLSICYEHGLGTAADHSKAAELWGKYRDHSIVCYLGTLGQCPATVQTYEQELELTKLWAEKKGDAHAQYLLAVRHLRGWGVERDLKAASRWLKKAVRANHAHALNELGWIYREAWASLGCRDAAEGNRMAFACFEKSAATGDAVGYFRLGYAYGNGQGCEADEDQAITAYQKALALNPKESAAHNNLGSIYKGRCLAALPNKGEAYPDNHQKMLEAFRESDELKDDYAAYNLGLLAYEGTLQPKDLQAAYSYFESAAERGYPAEVVHLRLGQMLERGEGVPASLKEAAFHYRLAAIAGSEKALINLCDIYIARPGFSQNHERAMHWLSFLARRGHTGAIVAFGDVLIRKGDYTAALKFFKPGLESDHVYIRGSAHERLSRLYRDGLGTKPNLKRAAEYQKKAVELGNRNALYTEACALLEARQTAAGLVLLKRACAEGLASAIYKLGTIVVRGDGIPRDPDVGQELIRRAAEGGDVDAMIEVATSAVQQAPGCLLPEEGTRYAEMAEECNDPRAAKLLEQLAALQAEHNSAAPAETGTARPL